MECGGGNNRLVEVGPVREVLNGLAPQDVAEKMLRYWKEVRKGLNLEATSEPLSDGPSDAAAAE